MIRSKIYILLPSDKDGGGNRWSYLLANNLINSQNLDVNLCVCKIENEKENIYSIDKNVKKRVFNYKLPRIIALFLFTNQIIKILDDQSIILVSDPILSILLSLFSKKNHKIIRNIAADDYNLYNYSKIYKYSGLIFIYRVFLNLTFFRKNITNVFNSEYTFIKNFKNHKSAFIANKIKKIIIHPMMSNSFLNKKKIYDNKKKNIVILPRKHTTKGFSLIEELHNDGVFESLKIENIFLVFNEDININKSKYFKFIHPKSDDEIIDIFDQSFCFISTSSNEGFGLPPLEAISRNCIPIIGEAGGNATFSQNLFNCLTYNTKNKESLGRCLKKIYSDENLSNFLKQNFQQTLLPHSEKFISNKWKDLILIKLSNKEKIAVSMHINNLFNYFFENSIKKIKSIDYKLFKKLSLEVILYPFFIFFNSINNYLGFLFPFDTKKENFVRKPLGKNVSLCIQDWVCYENIRYKTLKNGASYRCGLLNQEKKFLSKKYNINKKLYISGTVEEHKQFFDQKLKNISLNDFKITKSSNEYLDFSSYKSFYNSLDKKYNDVLIFCNSSVSTEFNFPIIDEYLDYFYQNEDIGIMGISSNTKDQQSFIFNNFSPHIQTLFFITSTFLLNEIVIANNGIFPGENSTLYNKYSIIQNGELTLSKLTLRLGYSIAVVDQFGDVHKFKQNKKYYNCVSSWNLPKLDMRIATNYPSQAKILQ